MNTEYKIEGNKVVTIQELNTMEFITLKHVEETGFIEFSSDQEKDSTGTFSFADCADLIRYFYLIPKGFKYDASNNAGHPQYQLGTLGSFVISQK
jgi:hypothetical protein